MKRSKFSEEQIVYAIRQAESGTPFGDLCRQLGVSDATFYTWKKKYAHLGVSELRRLRQGHGPGPRSITVDYGTEFQSRALEDWAYRRSVQLDFIRLGEPVENAFIESFNGCLRDECLSVLQFTSLAEAQAIIEAWHVDYNHHRPHSSLGHLTPNEFVTQRQAESTVEETICSG